MLSIFAQRLAVTHAPHAARALACVLTFSAACVIGCAGKNSSSGGMTPQSPERQAEAEYDVARDFFSKGEPRQALDHVQKAIELDDSNAKILYFASNVYLAFCNTDAAFSSPDCRLADAESFARKAMKADSGFRDARNLLGSVLILENKQKEAIEVLEPLTRDPAYASSHLAWGNLGWAQVQAGQVDEGIKSLKNAVTQPKFCVGFYRLGVAFEKKGDLRQAEESLTNALSVDDPACQRLQDAMEARGRIRVALGKTAEARNDYDECRKLSTATPAGKQCVRALSQLGAGGAKASPSP